MVIYTTKLLEGSCDLSLIKAAKTEMFLNDFTARKLLLTGKNAMDQWYNSLKRRPALNGEKTSVTCKNPETHKPLNNDVVCQNGTIEFDRHNMKCVRKGGKTNSG